MSEADAWDFTLTTTDLAELSPEDFDALWAMLAKVVKNRLRHIQPPTLRRGDAP